MKRLPKFDKRKVLDELEEERRLTALELDAMIDDDDIYREDFEPEPEFEGFLFNRLYDEPDHYPSLADPDWD